MERSCASPGREHSYSYLSGEAQRESFQSLPTEVLRDFERLHHFQRGGLTHTAVAQRKLLGQLFPQLSMSQVMSLQERLAWQTPWLPGAAPLGGPNIVVTAQKAREWQRMFEKAVAFAEKLYGEPIDMEGIKPCTMTALALEETLPTSSIY